MISFCSGIALPLRFCNSYNKDNETNYINFNHAKINEDLLSYYKGLIDLRNSLEAFRRAEYDQVKFFDVKNNPFALGYLLDYNNNKFVVLFNADSAKSYEFTLPDCDWDVLVNAETAGTNPVGSVNSKIVLEHSTGIVLKKKS